MGSNDLWYGYNSQLKMKSGIYFIINTINNKKYVGSSCNIIKRFQHHKYYLTNNSHNNPILQRAWNKYGADNFVFLIIEKCDISVLLIREQFYIDLGSDYNICKNVSIGTRGLKMPNNSWNISLKKSVVQLTLNNEYVRHFDSIKEAARFTGNVNRSKDISNCTKNIRKSCLVYKWILKENYNGSN